MKISLKNIFLNDKKYDIIGISVIIIILLLFFNQILFFGKFYITGDFIRSDTVNQFLPFKNNLFESLIYNKLPIWTDQIFMGYPLFAEGQSASLYPVNLILFKLFEFAPAYNLAIFINFLILGVGSYYLAKSFKLGIFSSVFASLAFSLSSFFVLHITHQNIISTACFIPIIFYTIRLMQNTFKIKYFIFLTLLLTFSILGGSVQIFFYTIVSCCIYLILFNDINIKKSLLHFCSAIILSLTLSSIQLLPMLELVSFSERNAGLGNIALNSLPFHPRNLISLISPYIYGDPGIGTYPRFGDSWGMFWENTTYAGLITLFLAIVSLKIIKNNDVKRLWIFLLLSILFVLGKYGPLFWVYYLPVFNSFRVTARFLPFVLLSLSLLSAFSIEYLTSQIKKNEFKYLFRIFIFVLLLIDLFKFGYFYNPVTYSDLVLKEPEIVRVIKDKNISGRVISLGAGLTYDEINKNGWRNDLHELINHKNALDPDINMLWDIKNVDGYAGLYLKNNQDFINTIYSSMKVDENKIVISDDSLELLTLSAVEYLISAYEVEAKDIELVGSYGEKIKYNLYRNKSFKKGIFFVKDNDKNISDILSNKISYRSVNYNPTDYTFEVESETLGLIVIPATYYPGWKAVVNDHEKGIVPFMEVFRSVEVDKGKNIVNIVYEPVTLLYGKYLTIIGILMLTLYALSPKLIKSKY